MNSLTWSEEEQKEHRKEWVSALRSNEFRQGVYYLYHDGHYCALGVGCELMSRKGLIDKIATSINNITLYSGCIAFPPKIFMDYYGIDNTISVELTSMNDKEILTFRDIANTIERI